MIIKAIEIRDRNTFIAAAVIKTTRPKLSERFEAA